MDRPPLASRLRRALASCALLALAAAIGGAPASSAADEPFRGEAQIRLGAKLHAAFPDPATGPHRFTFFATAGTLVSASLTRDAGASLAPKLSLAYPGGLPVSLGSTLRKGPSGPRITNYRVRYAGFYAFEVTAKSGSGGYSLGTKGQFQRKFVTYFPNAPQGAESFGFEVAQGFRVSVKVGPRRRGPTIEITGIETPQGDTIPVLSIQNGAAAEVRDFDVPGDGTFRVAFDNHRPVGDLRLDFKFTPPAAPSGVLELGEADGLPPSAVEVGDPALPAVEGYVGSSACGRCHDAIVQSWSETAHNAGVRSWNRAGLVGTTMANDSDGDGVDDFHEGLDLATTPAFAAYGANAPKLSFAAGATPPNQVRIGTATYAVERTMGGNGLWMQRYLAKIGTHHQVLPFQFDETSRTYSVYRPEDWYDAANTPLAAPPKEQSFEAQCSGCHNTAETIASDGAGGFLTGYVELNIGCEQCHGPGAAHAADGDTRKIVNPRAFLAESGETSPDPTTGAQKANDVCARCHTKGESIDALPGSSATAGFGVKGGLVARFGDVPADFLRPTQDPEDFWGFKTNAPPSVLGDTSVASRSDRNHGQDIAVGEHGPDAPHAAACFDCHDPHSRVTEHQIRTSVTRPDFNIRVVTATVDNSLCLACHAQRPGDVFESLLRTDAAKIHADPKTPAVATAVMDHMRDIGMPVRSGYYDPKGTGVGRCTTCHMVKTATSGATSIDRGGFVVGGLSSHRFEIVWPRASAAYGVTNSCNACHPTSLSDVVGPILTQWANAAPGQTAFHGAAPPPSQDGIALNLASNPSHAGTGERRCISCHTAEGFVALRVNGDRDQMPQAEVDKIAKESVAQDRGISCDACHGRRADGNFYGSDANPLRIDKKQLCDACHNAETVTFADFRDHGAVVRHPQSEMLDGFAGDAPPGAPPTATTSHSGFGSGCITCHYDSGHALGKHDFLPNTATCAGCHPGLTTFDRPARGDYDGDGVVEGIQTEVSGLLDIVKAALLLDPQMTFAAGRFDYAGATDHALTGASDAQKRTVFNWYSVEDDKSRGVHNAARALQLLQKSYLELTGVDVPGAVIR